MKEAEIQKACNAHLRRQGVLHVHLEAGRHKGGKTHRKGIPDILAWKNGVSYAIEIKTEKGVVSPEQEAWMQRAADAGVNCYVVRSIEQFEAIFP